MSEAHAVCLGLERVHEHLYVAEVGILGEPSPKFVRAKIVESYLSGQLIKAVSLERRVDYATLPCVSVRVELYRLVAAATHGVDHK